jgi:hypothetical protein
MLMQQIPLFTMPGSGQYYTTKKTNVILVRCTRGQEHSVSENCSFQFLEDSWWEQRKFCTDVAADTLSVANHPLWTDYLKDELSAINTPVVAPDPATDGFTSFSPTARSPIKVGDVSLAFDPATGALSQLDVGGTSWASAANTLLAVEYQTYNISQFEAFQRAYSNLTTPPGYFPHDFGKPNDTEAVAYVQTATARSFWMKKGGDASSSSSASSASSASAASSASFLIELSFNDTSLSQEYGADAMTKSNLLTLTTTHDQIER